MKPATRIYEFCLDIAEFCENDPCLYKELLEEREKLGNPRKDFSLSVSIKPVNQKIEKQINLSDIKKHSKGV